jgi:enamine deaminase RidA (YjgF/YER057c/UK114 family)
MLQLHHLPTGALDRAASDVQTSLIGAACFGARVGLDGGAPPDIHIPLACVQVEPLAGEPALCEAWSTQGALQQGQQGRLQWCGNADVLFGVVQVQEESAQAESAQAEHIPPLQDAARAAYADLFSALDALGYPHLLRVWNHVSDINGASDGMERYRLFNIGRQDAFLAHGRTVAGISVPAASALGATVGAPLLVYCIAARQPATAIENPRQLSAYHYPQDYGPRRPTFSRASLVSFGTQRLLFISGTASIVGHRTLHAEDVAEQTRETLRNIGAILQQAQSRGVAGMSLADLHYKVYVRHAADWPVIRAELQRAAGTAARYIALQADVCRIDLLVEIEATGLQTTTQDPCA